MIPQYYLPGALILLAILIIWYVWNRNRAASREKGHSIHKVLELARNQFEIFNIKLEDGTARNGISALLGEMDREGLHFDINEDLPETLAGRDAVAYFKVRADGLPVFYAFDSRVVRVNPNPAHSHIVLAFPENLRVEKKRHFIRVQPDMTQVRDVSVWNLVQGQSLPLSTDALPEPICQYTSEKRPAPVKLEDISASGLALRFPQDTAQRIHSQLRSQLLCRVVYAPETESEPISFWCTGEVMNSRKADSTPPGKILGLEFTNWAVLKPGEKEIHWSHNSPTRGVKPILQWVEMLDRKYADRETAQAATIHP